MSFKLKIKGEKKYLPEYFSEWAIAGLAALAMVGEDNEKTVEVFWKKKLRYRKCFMANKENKERQTLRIGAISCANNLPELDFFKLMFS